MGREFLSVTFYLQQLTFNYVYFVEVYSSDCLLDNPFYVDPVDDCGPCSIKSKIIDLTGQSVKKMTRNVEEISPFVVKVSGWERFSRVRHDDWLLTPLIINIPVI